MNAPLEAHLLHAQRLAEQIAQACDRIAPTWPLDEFIAVNPYWGWVQRPIVDAAAQLGVLAGTRLTMPREWFRAQWRAGRFGHEHLEAAVARDGAPPTVDELVAALEAGDAPAPARLPLVADLRDAGAGARPALGWTATVVHQIGQHCAAYFDEGQARWRPPAAAAGLYASWRTQLAADRGLAWRGGRRWVTARVAALPGEPTTLIATALDALAVPEAGRSAYLSALLLSVNGWAAWCAYRRWQARLAGGDDDTIVQLLAVRLAWDWLLHDDAPPGTLGAGWAARWAHADADAAALATAQRIDWRLQQALEIAYQQPLAAGLAAAPGSDDDAPAVQAVFCIDVRSEVFRRALEAADPAVQTRGFAGFFGLPIAYAPQGSALVRPQLPGLLAPSLAVGEEAPSAALGQVIAQRRRAALAWRERWAAWRAGAASGFGFVEACGLAYGAKLLADSLPSQAAPARWEDTGLPAAARGARPRLPQATQDPAAAAALARGILQAMGLVEGFAPLVMLAGHGSRSANNPHAAGLDCGACGGQTGEVNARVLADLLNAPAVRTALQPLGITIPAGTHFVPALHDTTTDEVALFDTEAVPAALQPALERLRAALAEAGRRARAERAPSLGLPAGDGDALVQALRRRGNDWAQVRPEWGLAGNAAFVVAPRRRTRHLALGGRAFLHDYDWRADRELAVLELIMTAPMVVTNWINLQYHASMVDPRRYGSGDKVLHNVVGGRVGVFEGNGGDLRIGLPLQSLHDGRQWRHTPLRLSVFVEAPRAAIETVIGRHAIVRDLAGHGWLHLFRIDPEAPLVEAWRGGGWQLEHGGR